MIKRLLEHKIKELGTKFPVIFIAGPRQSGKTTLAKALFPHKPYVTLENPQERYRAQTDPQLFLSDYATGAIIDEVQRVPELLSYLQEKVDNSAEMGKYILTGSQNFLLMESVTQSLAGRVAIFRLLPFSMAELPPALSLEETLFQGQYPAIFDRQIAPKDYYPNYIETYLERDIRSLKQIRDLSLFQKFMGLCAGRSGQLLNLSSLSNETGISHNTAESWISLLETSFIVFRLQPYHTNFHKRLTKQPKLYFYDTGILCSLLGVRTPADLTHHPLRGSIFETFILSELVKHQFNQNHRQLGYFWRDSNGNEIDYLDDNNHPPIPIEIKSSLTVQKDQFKGIRYWKNLQNTPDLNAYLIYGGDETQTWPQAKAIGWKDSLDSLSTK